MTWYIDVFRQLERPAIQAYLPQGWSLPEQVEAAFHQLGICLLRDFCADITTVFARLSLTMSVQMLSQPNLPVSKATCDKLASFHPKVDEILDAQCATLTKLMMHLTPRRCYCRQAENCHCLNRHLVLRHTAFLLRCLSDAQLKPAPRTMHAVVMAFLVSSLAYQQSVMPEERSRLERVVISALRDLRPS